MEFPTNINKYLKVNDQGFVICTGRTINKVIQPNSLNDGIKIINQIINQLGQKSATAQGLKQVITNSTKFTGSDHRIYIKVEGNMALGFLRTGEKKLFYHDNMGKIRQLNPTCVLDIYVGEKHQRGGIGKDIFETFLRYENKWPQRLAYDRPSGKLFGFLKKHYNLNKFIPQNNNFVIFDQFFNSETSYKSQQTKAVNEGNQYRKSANRFYKYQNQQKNFMAPKSLTQTKHFNKTITGLKQKNEITVKKEQKIQDSLSLLEKEINRLHLKAPSVVVGEKQSYDNAKQISPIRESITKAEQNKITAYMNYTPWATTTDPRFRTTSNSYGSYYNKGK